MQFCVKFAVGWVIVEFSHFLYSFLNFQTEIIFYIIDWFIYTLVLLSNFVNPMHKLWKLILMPLLGDHLHKLTCVLQLWRVFNHVFYYIESNFYRNNNSFPHKSFGFLGRKVMGPVLSYIVSPVRSALSWHAITVIRSTFLTFSPIATSRYQSPSWLLPLKLAAHFRALLKCSSVEWFTPQKRPRCARYRTRRLL